MLAVTDPGCDLGQSTNQAEPVSVIGDCFHLVGGKGVDLHPGVVDAQAGECGQKVLHGPDRDSVPTQGGRVVLLSDVGQGGGDLDAHVRPGEADAVLGGCGQEPQADRSARVEPDARAADLAPQCSPVDHR